MTEQTPQPEVLGGTEEQPGKPTPSVSEVSAVEQPSGQQVDVRALAKEVAAELLPTFDEMSKRNAQSAVDKRAYQFDKMAEYLKAAGGDPKKAAREMALDQMVEREMAPSSQPEVPGRTKGEDPEARTAKFLNDLKDESGVELSDEELKQIWSGKRYTNYDDAFKDARKAAWKKAKQGNIGAGAAAAQPGNTTTSDTEDELAKELAAIQRGERGSPVSPENKTKRAEIKAKLAAARR